MVRPQSVDNWHEPIPEARDTDWQALRADLESLLDQVENRQLAAIESRREQPGSARETHLGNRHSAALRSVQKAVRRFADPAPSDERSDDRSTASRQGDLTTAIREIRERTGRTDSAPEPTSVSRPAASSRPALPNADAVAQDTAPYYPERRREDLALSQTAEDLRKLTAAVSGIAGRLERLESDVKATRESSGDVAEVAAQVAQLTHVVELLAGAVGDSSHVKRLESQISNLARMMADAPKLEIGNLTRRIDELGANVDRLADMQVQQLGRDTRAAEGHVTAQNKAIAAQGEAMLAIEAGIRNIYDRIDVMDRNFTITPQDFDRLTQELGGVTTALKSGANAQTLNDILARLDLLTVQIGQLDAASDGEIAPLKADVEALRAAVSEAVEPRFAALESRIEALSSQFGSTAPAPSFDQIEAQIKKLAQRMDQTGKQLSGLTTLYTAETEREPAPDFDKLATLVAQRTSEEFARLQGTQAGFTDAGLSDLEQRLSRLFTASAAPQAPEALGGVVEGISRVDERLDRLEVALEAFGRRSNAREAAVVAATQVEQSSPEMKQDVRQQILSPEIVEDRSTSIDASNSGDSRHSGRAEPTGPAGTPPPSQAVPERMAEAKEKLAARRDVRVPRQSDEMPQDPSRDAPLIDTELADLVAPVEDWTMLDGAALGGFDDRVRAQPEATTVKPTLNTSSIERPAPPKSRLGGDEPSAFVQTRESAREAYPDRAPTVQEPSLDRNTFIAAARRAALMRQEEKKPEENGSLIGRALARFQSSGRAPESVNLANSSKPVPAAADIGMPAVSAHQTEVPKPAPKDAQGVEGSAKKGFLARNRQTVLLGAALVAASLLTLNLVMHRLTPPPEPAPTSAPPAAAETLAPTPSNTLLDPAPTGSIDPFIKMDLVQPSPVRQVLPNALPTDAGTQPAPTDGTTTGSIPPADMPLMATAPAAQPTPAPIKLDMPPEALGPLDLRQAAANGDMRAQFEIGAIYTEGRAVTQDFKAAAVWYERAAAQGFAPAQYRLGNLYEHGNGVDTDLEEARLWYTRAAEAGNRMAMHNLAALYAGGALGTQQFSSAAEWFERAADGGLTDSQFNLGMLYARGLGVPRDLKASYKWFSLAARSGDKDAAKARDDIAKSLDPAALAEVKAELDAWRMTPINIAANFAPIGTWTKNFDPGQTITERSVTQRVQVALGHLGYDVGTADGVSGPKTTQAIKDFERATGMTPLGLVNPRLLAVLGSQPV